jgi:hypothetical protein
MIPPHRLDELKALFREDGHDVSDAAAVEAGLWLLARAKAVPHAIPVGKEDVWAVVVAQASHPHGQAGGEDEPVLRMAK